ncbi:deoxyguanosinetriphosphate triphosphohydrolase [Patescibacteria group bacterium]
MLLTKQQLEENEAKRLISYAMLSKNSAGRKHQENKSGDNRLCFQKDRDRIIHSKAFRRLETKTQVFVAHFGDHFRNRLTHTLEVSQISRDICRTLGLNEDLAESIALAHDLGHTPFGHIGESVLDEIMQRYGLHFEHNEQSRRIVEKLEKRYPDFDGLNLSVEVLDGLIKHKTSWDNPHGDYEHSPHLEAQVVNLADEIAYTNHDLDDGLRSKLITLEDLKGIELWEAAAEKVEKKYGKLEKDESYVQRCISNLIDYMVQDLYQESEKGLEKQGIVTIEDVRNFPEPLIRHSSATINNLEKLRRLLTDKFYFSKKVAAQLNLGKQIVSDLFEALYGNAELLPQKHQEEIKNGEPKEIVVRDYIAGMTDKFAESTWTRLNQ